MQRSHGFFNTSFGATKTRIYHSQPAQPAKNFQSFIKFSHLVAKLSPAVCLILSPSLPDKTKYLCNVRWLLIINFSQWQGSAQ